MLDLCLPSQHTFCHRFQGDSHLEQPGCYHHCVDENIERRNHYLDLAGIENYASQFGPGKGPLGGVSTENTVLGSGLCSLRTGEMWNFLLDISEALLRDSCIKDVSKMKVVLGQSWAKPRRMRGLQIQPKQWSHLGHSRSGPTSATAPVPTWSTTVLHCQPLCPWILFHPCSLCVECFLRSLCTSLYTRRMYLSHLSSSGLTSADGKIPFPVEEGR